MVTTASRGFGSPGRYIQGPGEFGNLRRYVQGYGGTALCIIDGFLYDALSARLRDDFAGGQTLCVAQRFGGECCQSEVDRLEAEARRCGAAAVVGIGGGKTLDTAKLVASNLQTACVIVPTSASTDAPTSAMSVLYRETGEHLRCICHPRSSDLVLVDSEIIASAPVRLFVAGMGDALSTWYEARANAASDTANYIGDGYRRCRAGMAIARMCYDILLEDGLAAKLALERGVVSEAVENVIEANILLSGLGFENTGCAGAHAIHTGFSQLPQAHKCYHGEIVAFGVLFQLVLENAPRAELVEVLSFCGDVGLPVTLEQLGVENTGRNLDTIAARVVDGRSGVEAEPFLVTADSVRAAILGADAVGRQFLRFGRL